MPLVKDSIHLLQIERQFASMKAAYLMLCMESASRDRAGEDLIRALGARLDEAGKVLRALSA